jgi:hypothetical protein
MSDKKEHKKPPKQKPIMTEEEKAAFLAEQAVKIADAKKRQEDLVSYERQVDAMTVRQLHGELRRQARKPRDGSPLTSALALVLGIVLSNTRTIENPLAKLEVFPR